MPNSVCLEGESNVGRLAEATIFPYAQTGQRPAPSASSQPKSLILLSDLSAWGKIGSLLESTKLISLHCFSGSFPELHGFADASIGSF